MSQTIAAPADAKLGRRGLERLDLLLLAEEALDLNGGEAMVWMCRQLGYGELLPDRVALWSRRCHNPLRRATRRGGLPARDCEALIHLVCAMAERLYPLLRQLLSGAEPAEVNAHRWTLFHSRLQDLLHERMNLRRSGVQRLLAPDRARELERQLILTLALVAGNAGVPRLRASLLDSAP
ncbi:DUF3038 domain-containing protein [Synechococcus sp. RSCCF101]|uniref:DUF3038 domain-containing protein n=1 Tax=Synechococcus sp. RSCCF101 TaxID=2511069 RepID=UPI0012449B73|nr:DUF3038 domain-containing protein [Synechococcus sp. RSCCF101]QEY31863.1 DUF3038 domain-containing protein [Synechococcus sp. RSCCF101]